MDDCSSICSFNGGSSRQSFDERNYIKGIARKKINDTFSYFIIKTNTPVSDSHLQRIYKLNIPPAWINVWVSINPKSHIQAIGVDEKGRKQYLYHKTHIKNAEKTKFLRLLDFITSLPKLESNMKKHNTLSFFDKNKVIVTILKIVKELHLRVGKEKYARENKSYGISSLKKTHVKIYGDLIRFNFKGKSNKRLNYSLYNNSVKNHIQLLLTLEGEKLFQYIYDNKVKQISDYDLNNYVQKFMGKQFTIKDFRTYAANYYFVKALLHETSLRNPDTDKKIHTNVTNALNTTAFYMRHTRAISKKSYVMGFCIDLYHSSPKLFISNVNNDPDKLLLTILKLYRSKILAK